MTRSQKNLADFFSASKTLNDFRVDLGSAHSKLASTLVVNFSGFSPNSIRQRGDIVSVIFDTGFNFKSTIDSAGVGSSFQDVMYIDCAFQRGLLIENITFSDVRFINCDWDHATFKNCKFVRCGFLSSHQVRKLKTKFESCSFEGETRFTGIDISEVTTDSTTRFSSFSSFSIFDEPEVLKNSSGINPFDKTAGISPSNASISANATPAAASSTLTTGLSVPTATVNTAQNSGQSLTFSLTNVLNNVSEIEKNFEGLRANNKDEIKAQSKRREWSGYLLALAFLLFFAYAIWLAIYALNSHGMSAEESSALLKIRHEEVLKIQNENYKSSIDEAMSSNERALTQTTALQLKHLEDSIAKITPSLLAIRGLTGNTTATLVFASELLKQLDLVRLIEATRPEYGAKSASKVQSDSVASSIANVMGNAQRAATIKDIGQREQGIGSLENISALLRWTLTTDAITRNLLLFALLSFAVITLRNYRSVCLDLEKSKDREVLLKNNLITLSIAKETGDKDIIQKAIQALNNSWASKSGIHESTESAESKSENKDVVDSIASLLNAIRKAKD